HVGNTLSAFRLQRQPLMHPKPVLLVDDGESQVLEDDVGLEEGVSADEDVDVAAGKAGKDFGSRLAFFAARQQPDAEPGLLGEGRDGLDVLPRQYFRG